ncbi:hypothetical protein QL285_054635 [Trifolium repens]|nr:hypothetical protein QL285_054635 [Trifolium repens]
MIVQCIGSYWWLVVKLTRVSFSGGGVSGLEIFPPKQDLFGFEFQILILVVVEETSMVVSARVCDYFSSVNPREAKNNLGIG